MPGNDMSVVGRIVIKYVLDAREKKLKISVMPRPELSLESCLNIMGVAASQISAKLKEERAAQEKEEPCQ